MISSSSPTQRRALAIWLSIVAAMVFLMIGLGGVTRLTGSGLSIMEWAPLTGALPPLSDAEWQRLYDLYRTIPQYTLINEGFGIAGFKRIFWLEWIHRLWGRLIGLVFLLPCLWFWVRGTVPRALLPRLLLLFVLGGLQGAVGWFMVASGFEADRTSVSPYRLVLHLGLAFLLYAALVWTVLDLRNPKRTAPLLPRRLNVLVCATAVSAVITMLAGGFVAGLRAGFTYNTFPLMDGALIPDGYAELHPFLRNWTENIAAVQWNHRLLATLTLLLGAMTLVYLHLHPAPPVLRHAARWLAALVAAQYTIGIITLILVVPVALGALHQVCAVLVLTAALIMLHNRRQTDSTA